MIGSIDPLEWQKWLKKTEQTTIPCSSDKVIDSVKKGQKITPHIFIRLDKGISNIEIIKASKHLKNSEAIYC